VEGGGRECEMGRGLGGGGWEEGAGVGKSEVEF